MLTAPLKRIQTYGKRLDHFKVGLRFCMICIDMVKVQKLMAKRAMHQIANLLYNTDVQGFESLCLTVFI